MSEPVQLGSNVLFFPNGQITTGKGLKLVVSDVSAVCTRDYLFLVPKKDISVGLVRTRVKQIELPDNVTVEQAIESMVSRPGLAVADLEAELVAMLAADSTDRVFRLAELKSYKVSGFGPLTRLR